VHRTDSAFLSVSVALLAFSLVYYLNPPAPRYYPLEHTWRMANEKGVPSMAWYGRSAWGLGAGALAGIVTGLVLSRGWGVGKDGERKSLPNWLVRVFSVAVVAALFALAGQIVHHEFHKAGTWDPWTLRTGSSTKTSD
jgi:hypothetical protein